MKKAKFTETQIVSIFKQADAGIPKGLGQVVTGGMATSLSGVS